MILNTHTSAKVVTSEYRRTLGEAVIDRNRVDEAQVQWLEIPASVGTGAFDNEVRGWMGPVDHNGAAQRYTPLDGPGHKGVEP